MPIENNGKTMLEDVVGFFPSWDCAAVGPVTNIFLERKRSLLLLSKLLLENLAMLIRANCEEDANRTRVRGTEILRVR